MTDILRKIKCEGGIRHAFDPRYGVKYSLGYQGNPHNEKEVDGFYFGLTEKNRHLFLSIDHEGDIQMYHANSPINGGCFISYLGDCGECHRQVVDAYCVGRLLNENEAKFARERMDAMKSNNICHS